MNNRTFFAQIILLMIVLMGCEKRDYIMEVDEASLIPIDTDYVPAAMFCKWREEKKAAYTVGFDDARLSHYMVSGPELTKRGMVGTFYLNTRNISDWSQWQRLFDDHHEIASHEVIGV